MNLTRCEAGHFYDADRYTTCPHCNQPTLSTVIEHSDGEKDYTLPLTQAQTSIKTEGLKETDDQQTVGYFGTLDVQPAVGWLVALNGVHRGSDYRLKSGKNFVGRSPDMDVCLDGENSISRDKHAVVVYEPRGNVFLVAPGEAKELFYINNKVVLAATEIKAYDILLIGDIQLLFIPCCSEKFNWENIKEESKEKENK